MMLRSRYRKRKFLAGMQPYINYTRKRTLQNNAKTCIENNSSAPSMPDEKEIVLSKSGSFDSKLDQNEGSSLRISQNQEWFIIGTSVKGNGHIAQKMPCQDSHKIALWEKGWGIAVISDGAGSATNSDRASAFLTEESVKRAGEVISGKNWIYDDYLPDKQEWDKTARELFEYIQNALLIYALKTETPFKELHATLIMVIFSPFGLLTAHVGDGRAGYQDATSAWKALITPFEGEQVGETVFMTMDMKKHDHILETDVIRDVVQAFTLLSDGCERVCWNTLQLDADTRKFIKPNTPFTPFFKKLHAFFDESRCKLTADNLMDQYYMYIKEGHSGLRSETDDKTMIIGFRSL